MKKETADTITMGYKTNPIYSRTMDAKNFVLLPLSFDNPTNGCGEKRDAPERRVKEKEKRGQAKIKPTARRGNRARAKGRPGSKITSIATQS